MSTAAAASHHSATHHAAKSTYEVAPSLGKCFVSGRAIQPGEKFIAALRETATGFVRVDITVDHWEQFDRAGVIAFWQSTLRKAEEKKKQFVDDQVLCDLFERLATTTESNKISFRFVLGLILMRKRLLIYDGSRREGETTVWAVRMKGRQDAIDLVDPRLDEKQMTEVTGQLGQILNEEL